MTPAGGNGHARNFGWDAPNILDSVFKAYDIRGTVPEEIDARFAHSLGMAAGVKALELGARAMVVARDGRLSSVELSAALQAGLRAAGLHVIDIGMATTPMLYFATRLMDTGAGIAVTGSHNPPNHNGFKLVLDGASLYGDGIAALRDAMRRPIEGAAHAGGRTQMQMQPCYAARVMGDIRLTRPMKIAVDCGNGVAGAIAPSLFRALGCEVTELFCGWTAPFGAPSGPGRSAEPAGLDLLPALFGLRDRPGLRWRWRPPGRGQQIRPDHLAGPAAHPVRARCAVAQPGRRDHLRREVQPPCGPRHHRGRRQGHHVEDRPFADQGQDARDRRAAGRRDERASVLQERWYGFDDGLYAAARLLEILSAASDPRPCWRGCRSPAPRPRSLETAEGEQFALVEALRAQGGFPGAQSINDLDGVRVDYVDGFGLARPSNTTPTVVLRFEGDTMAALARIEEDFRNALRRVAPHVRLPF